MRVVLTAPCRRCQHEIGNEDQRIIMTQCHRASIDACSRPDVRMTNATRIEHSAGMGGQKYTANSHTRNRIPGAICTESAETHLPEESARAKESGGQGGEAVRGRRRSEAGASGEEEERKRRARAGVAQLERGCWLPGSSIRYVSTYRTWRYVSTGHGATSVPDMA
eukprot:1778540-Rhodomonas_salina.1